MSKLIDLTGKRFGRWLVLERVSNDKNRQPRWLCRCECGREKIVRGFVLRNGKSCKCIYCARTKHGLSRTRLYNLWTGMIGRCKNANKTDYKYYGGRGIKVCPEWQEDFMVFREWALEHGYKHRLTIDRIDNDGNYKPENCRFATMKIQNRNSRHNRLIKIGNEIKPVSEWAEQAGINCETLAYRIDSGWPEHKLFVPIHS